MFIEPVSLHCYMLEKAIRLNARKGILFIEHHRLDAGNRQQGDGLNAREGILFIELVLLVAAMWVDVWS